MTGRVSLSYNVAHLVKDYQTPAVTRKQIMTSVTSDMTSVTDITEVKANCVRGWRNDTALEGVNTTLNLQPVFCKQYIAALEAALVGSRSDGDKILKAVQTSMRMK